MMNIRIAAQVNSEMIILSYFSSLQRTIVANRPGILGLVPVMPTVPEFWALSR